MKSSIREESYEVYYDGALVAEGGFDNCLRIHQIATDKPYTSEMFKITVTEEKVML